MAEARKIPLPISSGQVLNQTDYEAQGRWTDCDHIRFVDGQPEKIGGWEQWNTPGDELTGLCRSIYCWQDYNYNQWNAFGCIDRLVVFDQDKIKTNITPFSATGTLANPFSTTNTSTTVSVAHTSHGLVVGQYVNFSGASAVGGITISGEYLVTGITSSNVYTITHTAAATSTAGPGGGAAVAYSYELAAGGSNVTTGGGWGIGTWGSSTWGTERSSTTYITLPRRWSLDQYGQYLLAMPSGGGLYQWQVNIASRAAIVTNAPTTGLYMFVTSERIVVVLGADGELMTMKWCDDDDNTVWTPAEDNTATIRRLQEGSRLMAGCRLAQQVNVLWTDTALYLMQWTGTNTVYSTRVVATNCGLIGPGAFATVDGTVYWMTATGFNMYSGALSPIPRWEEIKPVFEGIANDQRFKSHAYYNPKFREVWWVYPSTDAEEPDMYVKVNIDTYDWDTGTMARTAFGLRNQLGQYTLLASDSSGVIYEHELGVDADGLALDWHIESAFFDLENGNVGLNIDGYIPDFMRWTGDIDLTFTSKDLPESSTNLETLTTAIATTDDIVDFRHFGRQSRIKLSQTDVIGGDFALGAHRIEVTGTQTKRQK